MEVKIGLMVLHNSSRTGSTVKSLFKGLMVRFAWNMETKSRTVQVIKRCMERISLPLPHPKDDSPSNSL